MTSKVLVKLPTVPFSQGKKSPIELVPMPNRHEGQTGGQIRQRNIYGDNVAQLEQNMKFLQDQHQVTLVALHQEVENLRQRNRDLQFQLVFSKSNTSLSSSNPSSPEDSGNGFVKAKGSPVGVNSVPLQVELLEKEIQDIKKSLDEAKTHNSFLNDIIEQQKKMLEVKEDEKKKVEVGVQVDGGMYRTQPGLVSRLQEAEALVLSLRQENEEKCKEIAQMKISLANANSHSGGSSRGRRGHHHNSRPTTSDASQDENSYKFPPLQSQSYWHRGSKAHQSFDQSSYPDYQRNEKNRHEPKFERKSCDDGSLLPQLRNSTNKPDNSASYPPFYRSRGYHSGNYYGGNKKYRGNRSQRRDQETENGNPRREYRGDQQRHHRQEYVEPADPTKDCKTSRKP